MGRWAADQLVLAMARRGLAQPGAKVAVLGLSFKENCPDVRNTRAVDVVRGLESFGLEVEVFDPWVDPEEAQREYGLAVRLQLEGAGPYRAMVVAVAHREFAQLGAAQWLALLEPGAVVLDLKGVVPRELGAMRL